ncbi:YafY family protein [Nocardia sp. BMG51109]|uniref:helix-turn-helix transcriptional regulator n=1 Tax=Nocardia sp. BMG51109 TaxID=1056816 RepID=UPI000A019C54|nr:WYL domain-containing protein [Nocardia sp. BMG51109]
MPESRLLSLLTLLQVRPQWSGAELVDRLEVTPRTLRRDIERLRGLGYPVDSVPGRGGGYRLGRGGRLPPLVLDDEEAVAVAVGLRTAAGGSVQGIREASVRALTKLDQVLPLRLRHQVAALRDATTPLDAAADMVDAGDLVVLARACADTEMLRFDYVDGRGRTSHRRVEPHRLVPTGRRWYLVARDIDRADWRSFRLDRLTDPRPTGDTFVPRNPPDAATFVSSAVGSAPYAHRARVIVHAPAHVVRAKVPPTVATITELAGDRTELVTGSDSLEAIAIHLAMLGDDFDILDPPELVAVLGKLADRLHRGSMAHRSVSSDETRCASGESAL